jgi:hypothetical protein
VLYETVAEHWPAFRERAEEAGGLPRFVEREVEEYLDCGILERGCLRLACRDCGHSRLIAFSCKRRGFCPSCLGRRMADVAVHLEERVLPEVAIRHWTCSLPWGLRALLGYDRELCSDVVRAFAHTLQQELCLRAKRELGLASVADAHTGIVVAVQRTDSALRLNVHLHVLCLDGVYVRDAESGAPVFHELPPPTRDDVERVAARTADRVEKALSKRGRSLDGRADDGEAEDPLAGEHPALASCYAASAQGVALSAERAGQPLLRLVASSSPDRARDPDPHDPVAEVRGINVHARQRVHGHDRAGIERLARYVTRPPLAQDRLTRLPDGRVQLVLKSVWRDGTAAILLDPLDLIARLCAAVPPPRWHLLRYFGVLSAHSSLRREVVPVRADEGADGDEEPAQLALALGDAGSTEPRDDDDEPPRRPWAWLLRHVFREDVSTCEKCGGAMRWIEVATTAEDAARLIALERGDSAGARPRRARSRAPPEQMAFGF